MPSPPSQRRTIRAPAPCPGGRRCRGSTDPHTSPLQFTTISHGTQLRPTFPPPLPSPSRAPRKSTLLRHPMFLCHMTSLNPTSFLWITVPNLTTSNLISPTTSHSLTMRRSTSHSPSSQENPSGFAMETVPSPKDTKGRFNWGYHCY